MKSSVLIVDDNPAVLSALGQLLEYEVEKVIGIKHRPLIAPICAAGKQALLNARYVVAAFERIISLRKTNQDLVSPLPDAIIGRPAVKTILLYRSNFMGNMGHLLCHQMVITSKQQ